MCTLRRLVIAMLRSKSVLFVITLFSNGFRKYYKNTLAEALLSSGKWTFTYFSLTNFAFIFTGFSTAKGDLVRSIMFPKPADFKFSQDAYKFIGVLFGISLIGMVYTYIIMVSVCCFCFSCL